MSLQKLTGHFTDQQEQEQAFEMCLSSSVSKDELVMPSQALKVNPRPDDKFGVEVGLCFFPVKVNFTARSADCPVP